MIRIILAFSALALLAFSAMPSNAKQYKYEIPMRPGVASSVIWLEGGCKTTLFKAQRARLAHFAAALESERMGLVGPMGLS